MELANLLTGFGSGGGGSTFTVYYFTVRVTDSVGNTEDRDYALIVYDA